MRFVCSHPDRPTMPDNTSLRRSAAARRLLLAFAALPALAPHAASLRAQTAEPAPAAAAAPADLVVLDPVVVTATRTPVHAVESGSAVDVISGAEGARRQLSTLADALGGVFGSPVQTGATGGATSVFLRGAASNQTAILVDGIRINDANLPYSNFLGGAAFGRHDEIEVLRGPQSTLYGADAMGGVISLQQARGVGAPSGSVGVEAGSHDTVNTFASAQGERGPWAYSFSGTTGRTDNERANNDYERVSVAGRLDRTLNERVSVGATVRGHVGEIGSPDNRFVNDPNNREREQRWIATLFTELQPTEDLSGRVILGGQFRRQEAINPLPNPGAFAFDSIVENDRFILDAQTSYTGVEKHRVTLGSSVETDHIRGDLTAENHERQWAVFAQDEWTPVDVLALTAGLRHDEFGTFGGRTTGRGTAALQLVPCKLKLRASYGTAFRAPDGFELAPPFGNPNLLPETSRGGDIGVDYYLTGGTTVLSATWFKNRFQDIVVYLPPTFIPVNAGESETEGVELSARTSLASGLRGFVSYTYLQLNPVDPFAGLRRPTHAVTFDLAQDLPGGFTVGGGASAYVDATDIDAQSFAVIDAEDYVVARVYASWAATERLTVRARVENLFDSNYEAVNGFPSLGVRAFAGVEWRF